MGFTASRGFKGFCAVRAGARTTHHGLSTWRFMGSYKWGYKSPSMGYFYSYPASDPTYDYP